MTGERDFQLIQLIREPPVDTKNRVDRKIGSVLGPAYRQLPKKSVWMQTGGSDETPLSTTLTLQQSQHAKSLFYVVLYFFAGPNPPQTDRDWVARRHMGIRFESAPRILKALHEEPQPDLPRDLTFTDSPDETVNEADKITHAAKTILDKLRTPTDIAALVEQLEATQEHSSRLLGMTVTGQQTLGISIP